ncbi:unnamed protein product [Phytomonas sp. EM1]|nr:unnamed protein product [Phytomonas sp. EM1]|eukprot:CCW65792.1 unnamed protein product [Phytomonas sp. isolate EM1]
MFDIIADAPENVLSAVISSLPEEGEEGYGTKGASALRSQDQGELLRCPPSSLCGGISTIDTLTDAEGFYYRDVAFHGYVLSVLMAIGLAMEKVNPLITQKVSELAARYADNVLGMRCTMLDAFLRGGGEPPHTTAGVCLSASVIPELGESHDITTFPRFFFNALNSDLLKALEDPREFWVRLPPLHCLRCIPC